MLLSNNISGYSQHSKATKAPKWTSVVQNDICSQSFEINLPEAQFTSSHWRLKSLIYQRKIENNSWIVLKKYKGARINAMVIYAEASNPLAQQNPREAIRNSFWISIDHQRFLDFGPTILLVRRVVSMLSTAGLAYLKMSFVIVGSWWWSKWAQKEY